MKCTRCHRHLTREPVTVNGMPYGRVCASKVPAHPDPTEPDLLTGTDLDGAQMLADQNVAQTAEASTARELAAMRASWGGKG